MTHDVIVKSELRELREALDALIVRVDGLKVSDGPTVGIDVMFAEMDISHKLIEARDAIDKLADAANVEFERTKIPVQHCQCEEIHGRYVITKCPVHTVDHLFRTGCCDQDDRVHRNATSTEYETLYPLIYDRKFTVGETTYRLDARRYDGGDGVTLTQVFPKHVCPEGKPCEADHDDLAGEYGGLCLDFPREIVPELIKSLQELDLTEPA